MKKFILSCCSTADITQEHFDRRDIKYICFSYSLNGVTYKDDLGKSMSFDKFYKAMAAGAVTKTSQVNTDEYIAFFTSFLEAGHDILHVSLSSGLSGSYNSARLAREELIQKFPNRKLYVVDSLCASSGYGLFMDKLADLRDGIGEPYDNGHHAGMDIDTLYKWACDNRLKLQHLFFSTDLSSYVKGGRVSKTAGFVGTLLNICPVLNMSHEGKLVLRSKAMGKKKAAKKLVERMTELAEGGLCYNQKCYICHSACLDDAKALTLMISDRFPRIDGEVQIYDIGTTIGSHTGGGTIALFFWGESRND